MSDFKPFTPAPEPMARVLSTECTHLAPGLPELVGGIETLIPVHSLAAALALRGVVEVEPSPNPDFTL